MADIVRLAREHTDLSSSQIERLRALVSEWGLIADLGFADLVLWVPTWNGGGFVAIAHQRPDTGRTQFSQDVVGMFVAKGRRPLLDRALASALPQSDNWDSAAMDHRVYPVLDSNRVIALLSRYSTRVDKPEPGRLEASYLGAADDLCDMVVAGSFPGRGAATGMAMRVGGGFIRLDARGVVRYASPNAVSAFRRLGVAVDLEGVVMGKFVPRLQDVREVADAQLARVAAGEVAGIAEVSHSDATLALESLPLRVDHDHRGALLLVRDISELRSRERELLTTEATLREVHHRVKNNLQMVAALLRMQARRADGEEARLALADAGNRIGAIAVVHDVLARSSEDLVDLDEVCDRILAMARELAPDTRTRIDGHAGLMAPQVASSVAMCLAEVVANAAEHAGPAATITLGLRRSADYVVVTVDDDGPGLPDGFLPESDGRLGMQIVTTLVREANGVATWQPRRGGGTSVKLSFPLHSKENRL